METVALDAAPIGPVHCGRWSFSFYKRQHLPHQREPREGAAEETGNRVAGQPAWNWKKAPMGKLQQQVEDLEAEIFRRGEGVAEFRNLSMARPHARNERVRQTEQGRERDEGSNSLAPIWIDFIKDTPKELGVWLLTRSYPFHNPMSDPAA